LKVTIVSKNSKIPVFGYGGTQRDIWAEGKILDQMGHKVVFVVRKGSSCPFGEIIPYNPKASFNSQIPGDTDIAHFHHLPEEKIEKPYMITIHGNGKPGQMIDRNSVFVSRNHAERHGSTRYVYNGLDLDQLGLPDLNARRDGLLYLAKARRRIKNLKGSIQIARMAGKKLHVAGGWKPGLNPRVKYYGMVGGEKKNRIIRHREALLFPVLWHEPLGLAILESMYFGLPVFGTPYGSLPELVSRERGFLSKSKSQLAWAVREHNHYDRKRCHEFIADNFSDRKMTEAYLKIFDEVLSGKTLNNHPLSIQRKYGEPPLPIYE
jgi:glycosyltransferase involved in cell wall biosynthesis